MDCDCIKPFTNKCCIKKKKHHSLLHKDRNIRAHFGILASSILIGMTP